MGAFFLFNNEHRFDKNAVSDLFRSMEMGEKKEIRFGDMTLWLYRKQLVNVPNDYKSITGAAVYITGTLVYRGSSYRESIVRLLEDYENGTLDAEELIGSFCAIFVKNSDAMIMHDRANAYHIFSNQDGSILTSSFTALVRASLYKPRLNRLAAIEYLVTGYVVGPDTIFEDIYLMNSSQERKIANRNYSFYNYPTFIDNINFCKSGFNECVDQNLELLKKYWKDISRITEEFGVEQGLSGGYDSRLTLILSKTLPVKPSVHTHIAVDQLHTDVECARIIAEIMGLKHNCIKVSPTKDMMADEAEKIMYHNMLWHDSRTHSEIIRTIRSKRYRIQALGNARLSINGVGGEIYRNDQHNGSGLIGFESYIKHLVIRPDGMLIIKDWSLRKELVGYIKDKAATVLGIKNNRYINRLTTRRYYAEIRLAYWHGCKNSFENKVAFFLAPFTESKIIRESYKMLPNIGYGGQFEAAMMRKIDEKITGLPNSYGTNFNKEDIKSRLKSYAYTYTPNSVLSYIKKRKLLKSNHDSELYSGLYSRVKSVRDALKTLEDLDLPVDWPAIKRYPRVMHPAINLGYVLNNISKGSTE